ncbi:MAG TPA: ABC transporter permease [Verrucomicrobiota bacterium]|nr:hypothetical protein [Verrucomicrobiales bacterium]HRI15034.1 ABC transporter permease [Verrucomicrobiota bacterium]
MWPVLQRELREQARQPGTYWLRVIAAGVVILLFWLAWEREANGGQLNGRGYFMGLHRLLFLGIWLVAPVLTADCLSREKREGTLGLLFLTPLRPVDVVVGKAFVHALRGLVFVLAVIPIMIVPVLLGGVSWLDACRMMLLQLAALGMALAAGLSASAVTESWWQARMLAFAFAVLGAGVFVALHLGIHLLAILSRPAVPGIPDTAGGIVGLLWGNLLIRQGLFAGRGFDGLWQNWGGAGSNWNSVRLALWFWLAAWLSVGVAIRLAALGIQRTWRSQPSARVSAIRRIFTEVQVGRKWWRKRQVAILTANPVRWLQGRTWSARLGGWMVLGMTLTVVGVSFEAPRQTVEVIGFFARVLLLGAAAFAAAASFRVERETGALELWLVTPLSPGTVVRGRLAGLAAQFFVPAVLLAALPPLRWIGRAMLGQVPRSPLPPVDWLLAVWIAATLVFGLGLALSRLSFVTAFALGWVAHHAPFVVSATLDWVNDAAQKRWNVGLPHWNFDEFMTWFSGLLACGVSLWGAWFARRQLAERRFIPEGASPGLWSLAKLREVRAP